MGDVGALDLSVHDLDVLNYLFGIKVSSLYCRRSQNLHATHEDGIIAT